MANKFFPQEEKMTEEVAMPALPKVVTDATSTQSYEEIDKKKLSAEEENKYNYLFLMELYQATRGSAPAENEIQNWMNALSQGGTREGVYRALVLDSTYAGLENFKDHPSDNASLFAKEFLEKFVGQTVKDETIKNFNFYSLKRICAEKALEILDAYGGNKESRSAWYAVLSSDFAKKYPQAFKNEIRKDPSSLRHQHWANNVPLQHLKSELVIKIHLVLNALK